MKASEVREVADHFIDALQSNERIKDKLRGLDYAEGYSEGFKAGSIAQPKAKLEDVDPRVKFTDGGFVNPEGVLDQDELAELAEVFSDLFFNNDDDDGIEIGDKVVHDVTGFKGTVTAICDYMDTDEDVRITPTVAKDGSFKDAQWFPIGAVTKVK